MPKGGPVPTGAGEPKPKAAGKPEREIKVAATNRRAWHDFAIEETFEAGIQLEGSEVKSLRAGRADLTDAYAELHRGELWLAKLTINAWTGSPYNPKPDRRRKLLVHKAELDRLTGRTSRKGMTLVPLQLYFNERGWAKVQLGVARGKKHADRRDDIKKREAQRSMREDR